MHAFFACIFAFLSTQKIIGDSRHLVVEIQKLFIRIAIIKKYSLIAGIDLGLINDKREKN